MKLKQRADYEILEAEQEAYHSVELGMILHGFCQGYFGRDSYGDKTVVEKTPIQLTVRENNRIVTSRYIDDWNGLVRSSNEALAELLYIDTTAEDER